MGAVAGMLCVTGGPWSAPAGATGARGGAGGVLTVSPTSGPVGTVVTLDVSPPARSQGCGQVVFGAPGQTSGGTAASPTAEPRSQFAIPDSIGDMAQVVHPGTYSFAVSCTAGAPSFAFTTVRTVFTVTSTAASGGRFVGMATTPDSGGYWLAQRGGGVWSFGDAAFHGSLPGLGVTPSSPVAGIAATADGKGYWLVGADGGVFAFGDATFYGSLPDLGVTPSAPVVGIAATADGKGYWLVGADGGVFAFGDAPYCTPALVSATAVVPSGFVTGVVPDVAVAANPSSVGYEQVDSAGTGLVSPWNDQACEPNTVDANYRADRELSRGPGTHQRHRDGADGCALARRHRRGGVHTPGHRLGLGHRPDAGAVPRVSPGPRHPAPRADRGDRRDPHRPGLLARRIGRRGLHFRRRGILRLGRLTRDDGLVTAGSVTVGFATGSSRRPG